MTNAEKLAAYMVGLVSAGILIGYFIGWGAALLAGYIP